MNSVKTESAKRAIRGGAWLVITLYICASLTVAASTYWKCVYDMLGNGTTSNPSASCGSDCSMKCLKFTLSVPDPPWACYACDVTSNPLASCSPRNAIVLPATLETAPCRKKGGIFGGCGCGEFTMENSNTNYVCFRACDGTM
jgi:hypothetical protein